MVINSYDIFELNNFPKPQSVERTSAAGDSNHFINCYYPRVGALQFRSDLFPHMHLMDIRWSSEELVELADKASSDTININFHLSGNLDTRFSGIKRELNMRPGKHNLVYAPEGGLTNRIAPKSSLRMFHLSIEKDFFIHSIGCDDYWSEKIQDNLRHTRAFAAVEGTRDITPRMMDLISDVCDSHVRTPMRGLLIQSKLLEVLAMQIGQFRGPASQSNGLRMDEIDKLQTLKQYLDSHFLSELSLSQLSRICLLNEFKLKKGFKEMFGDTVFGYLRKLRMEYAERLLLDSGYSVEEVAAKLGYEHAHHFSTAFKKYKGVSPSGLQLKKVSNAIYY
ncbi:helix-turn-helix transcriptional regulator [Dyadobacter crusticola]|uniref:helix-turn-helix transcriptional regulator n=1 Tax=Dyadobacter crusticola TaxID=292407 RepID=UPI0004E2713B|nr:AraC family transcriptional regulator [Dyadobacter crusticola]